MHLLSSIVINYIIWPITIKPLNHCLYLYLQIYDWLNKTAMDNPERVKVILIGSSFEKRPLYVVKVDSSDPS